MVQVPPFTLKNLTVVLLAAVAAALLAWPSPAGAAEKGVMPDLTWGLSDDEFALTEAAIADVGAKWVRLEFRWSEGEPRDNSYSTSTLAKWDKAVATAQAAGAKIIGMVHRSPNWASGTKDTYMPPSDPAYLGDFMRFMAARYKGQIGAWEIWNEQNGTRFWPTGPDATEYVPLLKAGYTAVKAVDPSALVLFGGLAHSDYYYVSAAYRAGAKGYFDVMVTHPYPEQHSPERVWWNGALLHKNTFVAYREVRRRMLAWGDDKPIWFTEMGWSTCTTHTWCVTEAQQADYLTRAYCILEQDPYVQVAIQYNLRNNLWDNDADRWETQLGLMTTKFVPKPAYAAFKAYGTTDCPEINLPPGSDPLATTTEPIDEPLAEDEPITTDEPIVESEPIAAPATSDEDVAATEEDEEPVVESSSTRRESRTLLRKASLASAGDAKPRRRLRKVVLFGRVKRATGGRVTLRIRRMGGGGARVARIKIRRVRVADGGRFRRVMKLRRDSRWKLRARYEGNAKASPSRSRILKFRT